MNHFMQTLDCDVVRKAIEVVRRIVGPDWIDRQSEKESKKEEKNRARVGNRKDTYLLDVEPHPLIQWLRFTKAALAEAEKKTGGLPMTQQSFLLVKLAADLEATEGLSGFEKIPPRLRLAAEFHGVAFECEVAAGYTREGDAVRFIGEETSKTPDLEVVRNGTTLFVECKTRAILSARDERVSEVTRQMHAAINRKLGPQKANALIAIRSNSDPTHVDVESLTKFVVDASARGGCGSFEAGGVTFEKTPDGKFDVALKRLALPDEILDGPITLGLDGAWDFEMFGSECFMSSDGEVQIRNPKGFFFANANPSDMVLGIKDSLKAAASQLPESGPGVIWIGVPLGSDETDFLARGKKIAESFLHPSQNRRVNAVFIRSVNFEQEQVGDAICMRYRSKKEQVIHPNPRFTRRNQSEAEGQH